MVAAVCSTSGIKRSTLHCLFLEFQRVARPS